MIFNTVFLESKSGHWSPSTRVVKSSVLYNNSLYLLCMLLIVYTFSACYSQFYAVSDIREGKKTAENWISEFQYSSFDMLSPWLLAVERCMTLDWFSYIWMGWTTNFNIHNEAHLPDSYHDCSVLGHKVPKQTHHHDAVVVIFYSTISNHQICYLTLHTTQCTVFLIYTFTYTSSIPFKWPGWKFKFQHVVYEKSIIWTQSDKIMK